MIDEGAKHPIDLRLWRIVAFGVQCPFDHTQYTASDHLTPVVAGAAQRSGRMRRAARLRPPMDKEDERASLRRDADDVVIRFAGVLETAGAQLKPASFWAVSMTDRVYVAAGGRSR
jgi:hypothetical protein